MMTTTDKTLEATYLVKYNHVRFPKIRCSIEQMDNGFKQFYSDRTKELENKGLHKEEMIQLNKRILDNIVNCYDQSALPSTYNCKERYCSPLEINIFLAKLKPLEPSIHKKLSKGDLNDRHITFCVKFLMLMLVVDGYLDVNILGTFDNPHGSLRITHYK
tara:strand:- start:802 stop:1281 length:480 start_codon:yes stop_codon:yes gene_type:complete